MFKNYLKVAFRNLWKHKAFSLINVSGLAVGMACCLLIVLFIQAETHFDRHHERADEIYRVMLNLQMPGVEFDLGSTMATLGPALVEELPEVTQFVRTSRADEYLLARGERRFYEEGFYFADASILVVFTYPLLRGDPATALAAPFTLVLTEEMALKYFGDADPMGQVLTLDNEYDFTVTGILAPLPIASHVDYQFMASFESRAQMGEDNLEDWDSISAAHTYVVIPGAPNLNALAAKIDDLHARRAAEGNGEVITLSLMALPDIHLQTGIANENANTRDVKNLYIFASIAVLILLIASINFINLSTARSAKRAREVGMRKVLGAYRFQLIKQFLGESVLLAGLSLLLAVALVELLLPLFNYLLETTLTANYGENVMLLMTLGGITLFVGIVAGIYPAFVLSGFRPVGVLKGGRLQQGRLAAFFRKGLVVLQFTIAIVLIIGSVVMGAQMAFFVDKDLGFTSEQVVVLPLRDPTMQRGYETFKHALGEHPGVVLSAAASSTPGSNTYSLGNYLPEGAAEDNTLAIATVNIDHDMVETLGLEMVAGRAFSRDIPTDTSAALLINESAVELLGWEDPLGKRLRVDEQDREIIGIVKDFHFSTLQTEIKPMALRLSAEGYQYLAVRISPQDVAGTLAHLEAQWQTFAPAYPFEYIFMDDDFAEEYETTQRLSETFQAFTFLAIFVACLGLFGLVSYTTEQRTKEIGVRKVLGASVSGILMLLSKDFFKLVAVAFVVAAPLAYIALNNWLDEFAYRIEISWPIFLIGGLVALVLALVTVSYQAFKAALANPVESLRYE